MNRTFIEVCILLGSNINPVDNSIQAVSRLQSFIQIKQASTTWETLSVGSPGPNFFNTALSGSTTLPADELKNSVLRLIENQMGRVRTSDKNAPRTIDLDIIIYNNLVVDVNLWSRLFLALPVSELFPALPHPYTGQPLSQVAASLLSSGWAIPHPELKYSLKVQRF